jgi:hypothetical protein
LHILQNVMKSDQINCKVPLPCKWTESPQKHFHCMSALPQKDIISVILSVTQVWVLMRTRLEITLSCWLSSNNRLEASKGRWCLESLLFLC